MIAGSRSGALRFAGSALGLAGVIAVLSVLRGRAMDRYVASSTYEDVYYLPPPRWLPVLSLGYRAALADLIWMRALVYFGDEMFARGAMAHVFDYTDAILELDPDFRAPYRWIATAGVYQPQQVDESEVRRATDVMRRGLSRFPDDGELAWNLGATLAFELPPLIQDPHERDAIRAEGADYMAMAARLGAAPQWMVLTNASILARVGRREAAARHLEEMYATVTDESVRAEIEAAIAELESEAHAEAFAELNREEELRRIRELPYVSPALYFVLGPRPVVDWIDRFRRGFHRGVLADPGEVLVDE